MDRLRLYYRGQAFGEFRLAERPMAVGSGQDCDIVVHDPEVSEHHWLLVRRRGTVVAYDLAGGRSRRGAERHVPLNQSVALGKNYSLTRLPESGADARVDGTSVIRVEPVERTSSSMDLIVGRGGDLIRYRVDHRPVHVGSSPGNDVVLSDRTVSARHCRIEPGESGVVIRDLGSRNGTYVNGVRVIAAQLPTGGQIRVGRTDLSLVERAECIRSPSGGLVADSAVMQKLSGEVDRLASLSWPVLVHGESGTGKEVIARALHDRGPRRSGPRVALNAGGLPRELIESELFGHERGAFTGAASIHRGVFEQADGGTLFLDEVGELPLDLQARLLRVIESSGVRRVGGENEIRVDVRLVCATHRDLREMVSEGRFRQDLYYRITRLVVEIPPLRSRPEDIRALALHFLREAAPEVGHRRLTPAALSRLTAYTWPGNARELYNVLSAACAGTASPDIDVDDVAISLDRIAVTLPSDTITPETLRRIVAYHHGNQSAAARSLGIARSTLRDRLRAAA
jgi:transcriptional regulator with AAA-type ATPase domain